MKLDAKWLLPPAAALCLILGSLTMSNGGSGKADADKADAPVTTPVASAAEKNLAASMPKMPDMWQLGSSLVGVVLLGGAVIYFARRVQKTSPGHGNQSVALRQTLRLTAKQTLHVVEFDNRLLLVGASDAGVVLVDQAPTADPADDEAAVLARAEAEAEDEGAVPKDLLIPRPERPTQTRLPTPPGQKRAPALGDFRALLQKAGKA